MCIVSILLQWKKCAVADKRKIRHQMFTIRIFCSYSINYKSFKLICNANKANGSFSPFSFVNTQQTGQHILRTRNKNNKPNEKMHTHYQILSDDLQQFLLLEFFRNLMLVNMCCIYVHANLHVHHSSVFMSTNNHKPYLSAVAHDVMGDKNAFDTKEEDFYMDFGCLFLIQYSIASPIFRFLPTNCLFCLRKYCGWDNYT